YDKYFLKSYFGRQRRPRLCLVKELLFRPQLNLRHPERREGSLLERFFSRWLQNDSNEHGLISTPMRRRQYERNECVRLPGGNRTRINSTLRSVLPWSIKTPGHAPAALR